MFELLAEESRGGTFSIIQCIHALTTLCHGDAFQFTTITCNDDIGVGFTVAGISTYGQEIA